MGDPKTLTSLPKSYFFPILKNYFEKKYFGGWRYMTHVVEPLAWHAQSPGFHLCHHIKSDVVVQMLSREKEQKFKIILSYIVTLRLAWAR